LIGVLHDDAEGFRFLIVEGFLVGDHEGTFDGSQKTDLVERIPFILLLQFVDLDLPRKDYTCFIA
jgi:hypothetical protein